MAAISLGTTVRSDIASPQAIAADNLRLVHSVVATVSIPSKHRERRAVAAEAGSTVLNLNLSCTDLAENRARAETRKSDVVGLVKPS